MEIINRDSYTGHIMFAVNIVGPGRFSGRISTEIVSPHHNNKSNKSVI